MRRGEAQDIGGEASLFVEAELVRAPGDEELQEFSWRICLGMNLGNQGIEQTCALRCQSMEDIEFGAFGVNFTEANTGERKALKDFGERKAGDGQRGGDREARLGGEARDDGAHATAKIGGNNKLGFAGVS